MLNFTKPQSGLSLNFIHPTANGLTGAWLLNEGSGLSLTDATGANNSTKEDGGSWIKNICGPALRFTSSTEYIQLGESARIFKTNTSLTNLSFVLGYRRIGYVAGGLFGVRTSSADPSGTTLGANITTQGQLQFMVGNIAYYGSYAPLTGLGLDVLAFVNSADRGVEIWQNGRSLGSTGRVSVPSWSPSSNPLVLGDWFTDNDSFYNTATYGEYLFFYTYNQALTQEQITKLSCEPFEMFKPTRMIFHPQSVTYNTGSGLTKNATGTGAAVSSKVWANVMGSGNIQATGTSHVSKVWPNIVTTGEVFATGSSENNKLVFIRASGGLKCTGTNNYTTNYITFGGMKCRGSAENTLYSVHIGSGGAKLSGTARRTSVEHLTGSGEAELSGTPIISQVFLCSGGIAAAGEAKFSKCISNVKGLGGIEFPGTCRSTFYDEVTSNCEVKVGGHAQNYRIGNIYHVRIGYAGAMGGSNPIKTLQTLRLRPPQLLMQYADTRTPTLSQYRKEIVGSWCEIQECRDKILSPCTVRRQKQYLPPKTPVVQGLSDQTATATIAI